MKRLLLWPARIAADLLLDIAFGPAESHDHHGCCMTCGQYDPFHHQKTRTA